MRFANRANPETGAGERSPLVIAAALVTLLLPVLYVLSCGPVRWLGNRGHLSAEVARFFSWFYWPLACASQIEIFGKAMAWYLSFWD